MMKVTRYAMLAALALHVGACGEEPYTVVRGACSAIVDGTVVQGDTRSTVRVGDVGHCTGTYIAPGVVMTAAHCGNPAYIMADDVVLSNILYVPHPQYAKGSSRYDIALVFLEGELSNREIASLGVAQYGAAIVQGYGMDEDLQAGTLKEAITDVVEFLEPDSLATSQGPDSCFGDSGGPLYQGSTVVGITRSGLPGAARGFDACGQGGLYTLVSSFRNWLDSEVAHLNWVSTCGTL